MKKIMCLLLCCVIISSFLLVPTSAVEVRASSIFNRYNTTVQKSKTSGDLDITVTIYATEQMDSLGATEIKLQKEVNGRWISVATFTPDTNSGLMSSNAIVFQTTVTYETPVLQSNYRSLVTIYGCSGSTSDSVSIYSNEFIYR